VGHESGARTTRAMTFFGKTITGVNPNAGLSKMGLTRRHFIQWILGLPLLPYLPFHARETEAQPFPSEKTPVSPSERTGMGNSIGQFFNGEELTFEAGFWIIKRGAMGRLSFRVMEKKGYYTATFQGETLGVLGWVARYRVDTYRSVMEEIDGGKALRSVSFEEDVKVGDKIRRRIHLFDYQRRIWTNKHLRTDGTWSMEEKEIPPGMVYDDFITASYNFRYGVYGPIERGKKYVVATFPRKGLSSYEVRIAPREEEERKRKSGGVRGGNDLWLKLKLDPETTYSKEGLIEGWLSKDLCPMEGVIKDVTFLGDVRGILVKRIRG
jgi:hypothetical protein